MAAEILYSSKVKKELPTTKVRLIVWAKTPEIKNGITKK
jgi:hypothetical protein